MMRRHAVAAVILVTLICSVESTRVRSRLSRVGVLAPVRVVAPCKPEGLNIPGLSDQDYPACAAGQEPCFPADSSVPMPPGLNLEVCPSQAEYAESKPASTPPPTETSSVASSAKGSVQTPAPVKHVVVPVTPPQNDTRVVPGSPIPKEHPVGSTVGTQAGLEHQVPEIHYSTRHAGTLTHHRHAIQNATEHSTSVVTAGISHVTPAPTAKPGQVSTPGPTLPATPIAGAEGTVVERCPVSGKGVERQTAPCFNINCTLKTLDPLVKSQKDERSYRRLQMVNGLDVVLVSDPKSTKAAAGIDVNSGYWHDPEDIPGLAHFCEHMLFLGNKKYPVEDSYTGYLSTFGGSSNAYTSMMNTNFYFDVLPDHLDGALDRFAQFFIAPLFTEAATGREEMAVNAENVKNLQSDSWRMYQLVQSLAKKSHPFHKFGTGSSATLGKVPPARLRDELLKYWSANYVAHNMRLVVLGKESLDELQALALKYFTDVPSHRKPTDPCPQRSPVAYQDMSTQVYDKGVLGSKITMASVKDSDDLILVWLLPPQTPMYRQKNVEYVSMLLGAESPHSLLSVLKREGLATGLTAGVDLSTGNFDLFQIDVSLTKKGLKQQKEVAARVFDFIKLVEDRGVEEWRWREQGTISAVKFKLKNKEAAQDYVSSLSASMGKFQGRELLMARYMFQTFDAAGIKKVLSVMTPENALIITSTQKPDESLHHTEKWYGTKYNIAPLSGDELAAYKAARSTPVTSDEWKGMSLPAKNLFIPSSLIIKSPIGNGEYPKLITNVQAGRNGTDASIRLWFKQDTKFKRPRANVLCKMWSKQLYATPRDVVLSSLYSKLVRDELEELTYSAQQAGFSTHFDSDVDGFNLRFQGYDSGLARFIGYASKHLMLLDPLSAEKNQKGFAPHPTRFAALKEQLGQEYANFMFGQPHEHASYSMDVLLESPHWHITDYIKLLPSVDLQEVITWSRGVYKDMALECLAHGNLHEADATEAVDELVRNIEFKSNSEADRRVSSQMQRIVEVDGAYQFTMKTPNKADENSAVYSYFQYEGSGTIDDDLQVQLLADIMAKPTFYQLRTVEQLGYIVWSGVDAREGINGIRIIVQSPKHNATYLDSRVMHFMKTLRSIVRKMSDKKFKNYVDSLVKQKETKSRTLAEDTSLYWYEISTQQYLFDRRIREVDALNRFTREMFWKFFDDLCGYNSVPSKVSVRVNAQSGPGAAPHSIKKHVDHGIADAHYTHGTVGVPKSVEAHSKSPALPKNHVSADSEQDVDSMTLSDIGKSLKEDDSMVISSADDMDEDSSVPAYESQNSVSDMTAEQSNEDLAEPQSDSLEDDSTDNEDEEDNFFIQLKHSEMQQVVSLHCHHESTDPRCKCAVRQEPTHHLSKEKRLHTVTLSLQKSGECDDWSVVNVIRGLKVDRLEPAAAPKKPEAAPATVKQPHNDPTCDKSGPRKWYQTRPLTDVNIAAFQDGSCLFPKRAVGKITLSNSTAF